MSISDFDPEILQDFLTESGELLEQLEGDLVALESTPQDPSLLNQIFRALHTIKGSASFLALTNLVAIAHASESALNAARNGTIVVDRAMMDLLLEAVDLLKVQFEQLASGETDLEAPEARLVDTLSALGEGHQTGVPEAAVAATAEADAGQASEGGPQPDGLVISPIEFDGAKADILEPFIADVEETLVKLQSQCNELFEGEQRVAKAGPFSELCDELARTVDFFEVEPMSRLAQSLVDASERVGSIDDSVAGDILPRVRAIIDLLTEQSQGLSNNQILSRPTDTLLERLERALSGTAVDDAPLPPNADSETVFGIDLVKVLASASNTDTADHTGEEQPPVVAVEPDDASSKAPPTNNPGTQAATPTEPKATRQAPAAIEQTIRVEVGRLETLMNLVGELVLQKNRIGDLSRKIGSAEALDADMLEAIEANAGGLDRVTADIQTAVMRTRMQPLDKLFGKYPRLIRDLAKKTGKKINLVIEGGETEVDKSVIEELGDPLVHLMRNSADHGLEPPEERAAAGKDETGIIALRAAHEGSHVRIDIVDDGRGLKREVIGGKALERGLVSEAELQSMADEDVFRFIFEAGFSTADAVSDLSGRGVGMDVVRTNIENLKGSIGISSETGKGTTISISIPLTIAIMPAMMVGIAEETYAIPLGSILEIVRPTPDSFNRVADGVVVRLRDSVLPVLNGEEVFNIPEKKRRGTTFAVVLALNERRVCLLVTSVIGQQEIVIKPLDGIDHHGPVSGATVRNDGGVSLIVDVAELIRSAKSEQAAHAGESHQPAASAL